MNSNIIYDGHIHMPINRLPIVSKANSEKFAAKAFKEAGIGGGLIISPAPYATDCEDRSIGNKTRMTAVLDFCSHLENYYPCYWIDPTEKDAVKQVIEAKECGIRALKVICINHHPAAGLECYNMAAKVDLPILFHSGTHWDGVCSADFNRPTNWECMLSVYGCRFALAHISWPWQSECMALFGKINQANMARKECKCEMYVDCCPGTPEVDREDIFRRFELLGYHLADRLIWGVDTGTDNYCGSYAKWIYDWDDEMFDSLQKKWKNWKAYRCEGSFMAKDGDQYDFKKIFRNATQKNLLRFLGEKAV